MGFDDSSVMFLCGAKSLGVDFTRTAMIGRQWFYPSINTLKRVFTILGIERDAGDFVRKHQYSEDFLSLLGADKVVSLDYSSYEGATIIHDMNTPIPDTLREQFSVVHDGGTIEHVFHVTQALKNCMEMVRVGGYFTQVNEANNFMGHGFWQFSPEMIFRAFSPANGYRIEAIILHEVTPRGGWYVVTDPDKVHSRVELCNSRPTYILTIAKRISRKDIFAIPPQQSDYVAVWAPAANKSLSHGKIQAFLIMCLDRLRRILPVTVRWTLKSMLERLSAIGSKPNIKRGIKKSHYRQIDEDALLHGLLTS